MPQSWRVRTSRNSSAPNAVCLGVVGCRREFEYAFVDSALPQNIRSTTGSVNPPDSKEASMAKLNINGKAYDVKVEDSTPLLWVIREQVGLTGTKYGCGVAQCGACSVHVNDAVIRSCSFTLSGVTPTEKTVTISGLSATS